MKAILCFTTFVLLVVMSTLGGSPAKIKEIRERYNAVSELIEHEELLCHEIVFKTLVPGIGYQFTNTRFYYEFLQNGETGEILESPLIKITMDYSIAASVHFYIEYLFDESENVVFYFLKAQGAECGEQRFYFDEGKLIKVKCNPLDECDESEAGYIYKEYERTADFSIEDHARAKKLINKAREYVAFFDEMGKIEGLDK